MELVVWLLAVSVGWCSADPPDLAGGLEVSRKAPAEERVKTIRVTCHPDSLEVTVKADMFEVGVPVYSDELRLGAAQHEPCRARASSADEYTILVGLAECGTRHWVSGLLRTFGVVMLSKYSCSSGNGRRSCLHKPPHFLSSSDSRWAHSNGGSCHTN